MLVLIFNAFLLCIVCQRERANLFSSISSNLIVVLLNDHITDAQPSVIDGSSFKEDQNHIGIFETEDVVYCLDSMYVKNNRSVSFAFLGDSLVRNQFLNFISVTILYDHYIINAFRVL